MTPASTGNTRPFTRRAVPRQTEMGSRRRTFAYLAIAIGGFAIGTTEFVSMGLLNLIADDYGITPSKAGNIISAYALGVVIGAPLITAFTGRIPRRRLLLILMLAFTIGNALSVVAPSYLTLMGARFIAGLPHGAYFGVSSLVAVSLADPGKRGRAIALVSLGLPIAAVIGVPAAQALGSATSWHVAYGLVTAIGAITIAALFITLPHMTLMPSTSPMTELGALVKPQVVMTLLIGAVGFGGMFAVYTYITWTMTEVAGFPASLMWLVLMGYGVGMVIGTWIGGLVADRDVEWGVGGTLVVIAIVLLAFFWLSHNPVTALLNFVVVGMSGSVLVPCLQTRLMDTADDAQTLAAALNHSALNIANAGGAALGGVVIAAGFSYSAPALAGAGMSVAAIALWVPTMLARRKQTPSRVQ